MSNEHELKDVDAATEENKSDELTEDEVEAIAGGGVLTDIVQGAKKVGGDILDTAGKVLNDLK